MNPSLSRFTVPAKILFGAGLVAWMVHSGKMNLSQITRSLSQWPLMLVIVGIGYIQVGVTAWRWRTLLKAQQFILSFGAVWELTMIGTLFNLVIPGAIGGDFAKGYYITRGSRGRSSHAAISILMDRAVGLLGLLTLGAFMAVVNWRQILGSSATQSLAVLTIAAFLCVSIVLFAAVIWGGALSGWSLLPSAIQKLFHALHEYRRSGSVVVAAVGMSIFNHSLACVMYYLALMTIGVRDVPIDQFFLIVPLGLVAIAIPISPAGIGVGQAAFFALFHFVAPSRAAAAADAFTVYQLMFLIVCLSGFYWYVSPKHHTIAATEVEETKT
jgi:uncharacterized membrane protein YbhN (UPF0104 family)